MKSLNNIVHIPGTYFKLFFNVKKQKKFITYTLAKDIEKIQNINDGSINENDLKKITSYYGMGIPAILGTSFAILRGYDLSPEERMASTYLGAITGLGDDFFDLKDLSNDQLKYLLNALLNNPYDAEVSTLSEKIFLQFYIKVLENTRNHENIKFYTSEMYKAQVMSLKQTKPDISKNEIKDITLFKGGISLLLCRSIFNNPFNDEEKNMLHTLGGLIQLGNDIFDVYKDCAKNVKTLANTESNIENLRKTFTELMNLFFLEAFKTNFKKSNIKSFLRFISMGICRTFVCLDMLENLQKANNNVFEPNKYSRKELICDMEKPGNILKSIKYYTEFDYTLNINK